MGSLDHLRDELMALREQGLLLHQRTLEGATGARARFDGREVINLASNNYLGLANHPRVNEAASKAALELGAGSGAVRTIAGTMTLHHELERRFADFKRAEDALMFIGLCSGCVERITARNRKGVWEEKPMFRIA